MSQEINHVIKHAAISLAAGTQVVVAAVPGRSIRVVSMELTLATGFFQSGVAGSALTGDFFVRYPLVMPLCADGWFQTTTGEALYSVNPSTQTAGSLSYMEV